MLGIRGVHLVKASEPVYLVDVAIDGSFDQVDWGTITQVVKDQPRENWQAVYDERELGTLPDGRGRAVFFFHYLELNQPLLFGSAQLPLPRATPVAAHLVDVEYEPPC